jgi:hypothetical protein
MLPFSRDEAPANHFRTPQLLSLTVPVDSTRMVGFIDRT